MVEVAPAQAQSGAKTADMLLLRQRLRFSDSRRDSHWQLPRVPRPPSLAEWLVGLR